ncbi:MAG: hypothetical protein IPM17_14060 [Verrucomicrobia bacterium]|nr:hypothetical protein [Verrucomicrobiota bacterium]
MKPLACTLLDRWPARSVAAESVLRLAMVVLAAGLLASQWGVRAEAAALRISVYATADDVLRHLAPTDQRDATLAKLRPLGVSRVFLEGRRGDEYVPPRVLAEVRDWLAGQGIASAGGIATVPGNTFGTRQNEGLGWLNWEDPRTRRDVAGFFSENADVFDEVIVDDFFCTGDTSPASDAARAGRPWSQYRRDLLVSLIEPMIVQPARARRPDIRLIIKFPQWYDRFHLFGYDPERMAPPFDRVWVGTEARNPLTRRMGYVQPTEGYMNFRWLHSVCGEKTVGAWFDHIECTAENFVDQAFQSVLAGASELTLFRLGDIVGDHPGDALLARRLPDLFDLAQKVKGQTRRGIAFYKPPNSDADDNLYLADYLGMIGLPILPTADWPANAAAVFLGAQAAADPEVVGKLRGVLDRGGTVVVTPAFLRRVGERVQLLAGVAVGPEPQAGEVATLGIGAAVHSLAHPLDVDLALEGRSARVRISGRAAGGTCPVLTERRESRGRFIVLNARTFSEADFRAANEWLLSPKPLGWSQLPAAVANEVRTRLTAPLRLRLAAPGGVGVYRFTAGTAMHNFRDQTVEVRAGRERLAIPPHDVRWVPAR